MGYKFNGGNGAWICDNCGKVILDYLPHGYVVSFLAATEQSEKFKGIEIWSRGELSKRYCSAKCMKGAFNEDDATADIIYSD